MRNLSITRPLLGLLLSAPLALTACKNDEGGTAGESTADPKAQTAAPSTDKVGKIAGKIPGAPDLVDKAKDLKATAEGMAKEGASLTLDQYEALLVGLSACQVDDRGIDRKCEAWAKYNEARKNRRDLIKAAGGGLSNLGKKHISHESPAVRLQAATLMGSLFGASQESQQAIVDAAKKETVPGVLKAMLRTVSSSISKNPAVLALMMQYTSHENAQVRKEVVSALTSSWSKGTEGTLEKAMQMVEKDADEDVRRYGCSRLGARGDERALPLLEKLTADASKDPRLYADCMRGLIGMWSSPIVHDAPSKKAYELTLKRLKQTPRSEHMPAWASLSSMMWAKNDKFQQRADWFKKDELLTALSEIVKDRGAYWMARTSAVDTMKELGADKPMLETLKATYADAKDKPGQDKHVLDKIEKALSASK